MHKVFGMAFGRVYPLYVAKVERKGHTKAELDTVIEWLTGYDPAEVQRHCDAGLTLEEFFAGATINPAAPLITGMICGIRVETIEDPLMQQIRWLDKLVDEVANGKSMQKVLRAPAAHSPG